MIRLGLALVIVAMLAGCSTATQVAIDTAINDAETGIKTLHDRKADVYFKLQCAMPVGGMLRTRTVEEQERIMLNCGGGYPEFTPEEAQLIRDALEP